MKPSVTNILKSSVINFTKSAIEALGHQGAVYKFLFVVFTLTFLVSVATLTPSLGLINAWRECIVVYGVLVGFLMIFQQINNSFADQLNDYAVRMRNRLIEIVGYLRQQMGIWRQLVSCFIAVNPRPEISFFQRLSSLIGLAERPLPNATIAFRS